jgi:hypothetical protein
MFLEGDRTRCKLGQRASVISVNRWRRWWFLSRRNRKSNPWSRERPSSFYVENQP